MLKEYRTVLPYLREYRGKYAAGALCLVVVDGAQLLMPQLVKKAVDLVASGGFETSEVLRVSGEMLLVAIIISAARFLWRYFIHGSSRRIEAAMRDKLFARLMDSPPPISRPTRRATSWRGRRTTSGRCAKPSAWVSSPSSTAYS
jgi:ATP-binding cassette subfamily B multidrug efflux pump